MQTLFKISITCVIYIAINRRNSQRQELSQKGGMFMHSSFILFFLENCHQISVKNLSHLCCCLQFTTNTVVSQVRNTTQPVRWDYKLPLLNCTKPRHVISYPMWFVEQDRYNYYKWPLQASDAPQLQVHGLNQLTVTAHYNGSINLDCITQWHVLCLSLQRHSVCRSVLSLKKITALYQCGQWFKSHLCRPISKFTIFLVTFTFIFGVTFSQLQSPCRS